MLRLRTPILVLGTLMQPKIGVDPGKVAAQTVGALALGVLLTPVAALLAFVDGGLAKDGHCEASIAEAEHGKNLAQESLPVAVSVNGLRAYAMSATGSHCVTPI